MTNADETYIINSLKVIRHEVHENNVMLKAIIRYLAKEAQNASNENNEDFNRNILANMISNVLNGNGFGNR